MLPIQKNITPYNKNKKNSRTIQGIVIHAVGAVSSAKNNALYYASKKLSASAHYFVDANEIWQSVEDKDIAWHCGTAKYYTQKHPLLKNSNTIGIEMCQDTLITVSPQTIANVAELVQYLMSKYQIPAERVVRHWDIVNKECPSMYIDEAKWQDLKAILTGQKNPSASNNTNHKYKVGDIVKISTHYAGANDPIEKAVETDIEVRIIDIVKGARNPYHTNHNTYINDGDIRGYGQATTAAAASTTSKSGFDQNIKDLQHALNADGFTDAYGRKLNEDGIWGPNTSAAIAKVCLSTKTIRKYINVTAWVQCRVGTNPDGLYGNGTKESVKVFQFRYGISADGIAGKNTILTIVKMYVPNAT